MMKILKMYSTTLFRFFNILVMLSLIIINSAHASEKKRGDNFIGTVPLMINKHMQISGCQPIEDFYDSYIVVNPPFAWIDHKDFIYVCELMSVNKKAYKLVINKSNTVKEFSGCDSEINLNFKPGGLTIENIVILKENYIDYLDSSPLLVKPSKKAKVISLSTGDGGFVDFLCVKKKWFVHGYS